MKVVKGCLCSLAGRKGTTSEDDDDDAPPENAERERESWKGWISAMG
jgi:hypothetical protein